MHRFSPHLFLLLIWLPEILSGPFNRTTTTCPPCKALQCRPSSACQNGFLQPTADSCDCPKCPICCPKVIPCPITRICEPNYTPIRSYCPRCPECDYVRVNGTI